MADRSCNYSYSLFIKFDRISQFSFNYSYGTLYLLNSIEFLNARFTKLASPIDASQNFLRGCSAQHRYAQFTFTSDHCITIVRQVTLEPSPPPQGGGIVSSPQPDRSQPSPFKNSREPRTSARYERRVGDFGPRWPIYLRLSARIAYSHSRYRSLTPCVFGPRSFVFDLEPIMRRELCARLFTAAN